VLIFQAKSGKFQHLSAVFAAISLRAHTSFAIFRHPFIKRFPVKTVG